jgi:hypothetical protein
MPLIAKVEETAEAPEPEPVVAVSSRKAIISFVLTTVGWAASFALVWAIARALAVANASALNYLWGSAIAWGLAGALGGAATALVLHGTHPAIGRKKAIVFMASWSLGFALVWLLGIPLVLNLAYTWGQFRSFTIYGVLLLLMALGGGIVTGRAVASAYATLRRMPILIVLAWMIGLSIAGAITLSPLLNSLISLGYFFSPALVGEYLIFNVNWTTWAVFGAIFGAIGGGVMFWQIYRASHTARIAVP